MKDYTYFDTLLPQLVGSHTGPIAPTIVPSAAFGYTDAEEAEGIFSGEVQKPLYARMGNPTNARLESVISEIEGGIGAIATASGMGAISMVLTALLKSGDEVLCIGGFFGGTYAMMTETLPRFGIGATFCDVDDFAKIEEKLDSGVALVMVESVGNPNLKLPDLARIAALCDRYETLFLLDNTITPLAVQGLRIGADIVLYSTTKNICGHSAALGGIAVFRAVKEGGKLYHERYAHLRKIVEKMGKKAFVAICKKRALRDFGMSANAFGSFLTLLGIETLSLRMRSVWQHTERVAALLEEALPEGTVRHPSLESHEHHRRYLEDYRLGCGPMLTLDMGSKEGAFALLNGTKRIIQTANIGDNRTLGLHMRSTIYRDFDETGLSRLGITPGLIRLSIGLENPEDIAEDIVTAYRQSI